MLKIKDNVDLKELEKFGFKKSDGFYYRFYEEYPEYKNGTRISCSSGTIYYKRIENTAIDKLHFQSTREETASNIWDLIKADLVEKVDD